VLPPIYCSYLPSFCGLVSIVYRCSRCAFWHLHTVPIELPMSSTSDWQSRSGNDWRYVRFLKNNCLELLLMQLAQNTGWTEVIGEKCKGNQLYVKPVTSSPVLLRSTFFEMFCLWHNFVRSSHNTLYCCTLSTDFSTSIAGTRKNDCMSMWLKSRQFWFH
jgi:hypothetical protein